ncbi:MAG: TM1266 family iron-only hydrogenase system putative regulator [Candidatus Latescibacterota bacterium]
MNASEKRIVAINIVVRDRNMAPLVNEILTKYGEFICGRLGVPFRDKGISVISILMEADISHIGAVSGSLGNIAGVTLRSTMLT